MLGLEVIVLENDLEDCAVVGRRRDGLVDSIDLVRNVLPITAENLANINYHINLGASCLSSSDGFGDFDFGSAVSVRKSDNGANSDICSGKLLLCERDVIWLNAGGGHIVFFGDSESKADIFVCHCWMEERVVDHFGDLCESNGDGVCRHVAFLFSCEDLNEIIASNDLHSQLVTFRVYIYVYKVFLRCHAFQGFRRNGYSF